MRGVAGIWRGRSQGLTMGLAHKQMNLKLNRDRGTSTRKQVGDAESMINEGAASGVSGLFSRDAEGEV